MKKAWSVTGNIVVGLLAVLAICMMIFTVVSVNTFDRSDRSIFGYRMMVVLSDSMSATDFKAGDLIFVKQTDPRELKVGDVISYIAQSPENYGATVTHKIRRATTDEEGNPGFITYGTTTGMDDPQVVTWQNVLGKYQAKLPGVGTFFSFLRTVPGYLLLILLPFLILILYQGAGCVRAFREYREEQMAGIASEREKLREEKEVNERMLKELAEMRRQIESMTKEQNWPEDVNQIIFQELDEVARGEESEVDKNDEE